jgi:hypothetical protein
MVFKMDCSARMIGGAITARGALYESLRACSRAGLNQHNCETRSLLKTALADILLEASFVCRLSLTDLAILSPYTIIQSELKACQKYVRDV